MTRAEFKKYLKDIEFFVPTTEATARIGQIIDSHEKHFSLEADDSAILNGEDLNRFVSRLGVSKEELCESLKTDIPRMQEFISEQLYYGVMRLAKSSSFKQHHDSKHFALKRLMASTGLKDELEELTAVANEFTSWLKQGKLVRASWGRVYGLSNGGFTTQWN